MRNTNLTDARFNGAFAVEFDYKTGFRGVLDLAIETLEWRSGIIKESKLEFLKFFLPPASDIPGGTYLPLIDIDGLKGLSKKSEIPVPKDSDGVKGFPEILKGLKKLGYSEKVKEYILKRKEAVHNRIKEKGGILDALTETEAKTEKAKAEKIIEHLEELNKETLEE